jgi:glycerol-3-phosphate dehydrogenase
MDQFVADSCTDTIPLSGADGWEAVRNQRHRLAAQSGLHVERIDHLLGRYGSLVHDLLALIKDDPALAAPLPGADDYLQAEVVYAVSHEGARHLDDVLARRTRASIEAWDRGVSAAPVVATLMAPLLGWDDTHRATEVEHYLSRVAAERESQEQPDDATADAARLGAPDIVPV